jgi:DNA-binding response OmpR family regulator
VATPMAAQSTLRPLAGNRILIVEDNWIIAEMIAQTLSEAGAEVVGPFPDMVEALGSLSDLRAIDGAILDIGLGESVSYPLAQALNTTRVPFMFLTGVYHGSLPDEFLRTPHMLKPFQPARLIETLVNLVGDKS